MSNRLTPEQRRAVERALATPGYVGQVLFDDPDEGPSIGHSVTESDSPAVSAMTTHRCDSDR